MSRSPRCWTYEPMTIIRSLRDLGYLVGASSGLLDEDDIAFVGDLIAPGSLAGVLLYEHSWIIPMADALEAGGARIVTAAHLDPLDVVGALGAE